MCIEIWSVFFILHPACVARVRIEALWLEYSGTQKQTSSIDLLGRDIYYHYVLH